MYEGKCNTFHGKAKDKVEEESLLVMQEFHEHLETLMGSLKLAFSLPETSELTQRVCDKMKGEKRNP